ncbi:MAG: hypothetical protein JXA77_02455 [Bacteroidales bacterium]|nr:hypothetical protein [Bacteroidales bacterium]MBN2817801.1 hypothetical protein [Bacteroidales bacterium]
MAIFFGCYGIPDIGDPDFPEWIHDHNLCVIEDGNIKEYIHLERYTRLKYHARMQDYLEGFARNLKLIPAQKIKFAFVDNEFGRALISNRGQIRFESAQEATLKNKLEPAKLFWFGDWAESYAINHELAHIFSCVPFYGGFKNNGLLVHFDGGASLSNFSAWTFKNSKIKLVEAHYRYKWLSSLFNANALVFAIVGAKKREQNVVPGKFMGIEAYGKYSKAIEAWLTENEYFKNIWSSKKQFFQAVKSRFNIELKSIDTKNKFIQDIAATIHAVFIRESMQIFRELKEKTNSDFLYYTGGSALNIKLNAALINSGLFSEIYIPPCANDSGLSIGAAAALSYFSGSPMTISEPFLNNYEIKKYQGFSYTEVDIAEAAKLIFSGKIIGICNGFGEAGPRALGNRSLIARADNISLAQKLSCKLKKREWYRPVAPVVLAENARYFTGLEEIPQISKYMLTEFLIKKDKIDEIKACVHVDGTSRMQVLFQREQNAYMYDLLVYLNKTYQVKALINTSFNQSGEPIVHTVEQAKKSGLAMNLDALVFNGRLEKTS